LLGHLGLLSHIGQVTRDRLEEVGPRHDALERSILIYDDAHTGRL
jgi:hypothetical protein